MIEEWKCKTHSVTKNTHTLIRNDVPLTAGKYNILALLIALRWQHLHGIFEGFRHNDDIKW